MKYTLVKFGVINQNEEGDDEQLHMLVIAHNPTQAINIFHETLDRDPLFSKDRQAEVYGAIIGVVQTEQLKTHVTQALLSNLIVCYPTEQTPEYSIQELAQLNTFTRQAVAELSDAEGAAVLDSEVQDILTCVYKGELVTYSIN